MQRAKAVAALKMDRPLAGLALAANLLQLGGVYWDVATHHVRARDTFWSPPHLVIYGGVALALLAAAAGPAAVRWGEARARGPQGLGRYRLALLGPAIQVLAAPIDELWHRLIGKDVSIWSPPHLMGILGGLLGVLGWIQVLGRGRGRPQAGEGPRAFVFGFSVLILSGTLFALGEYDHDQAARGPWLYPALAGLLVPWVLVGARARLGWPWGGSAVAAAYTLVRLALAAGLWGAGLPWMGFPPLILAGAALLDLARPRGGPGAAGAIFALVFTASDFPLTYLLTGRAWGPAAWAGTLAAAAAAGWASGQIGDRIARLAGPRPGSPA